VPFSYKIEPNLNLICYAGNGLRTGSELLKMEKGTFQDVLRMPEMKIIVDT
jgi:hypothetical protein